MHHIYVIENKLNFKVYIGQTQFPETRWKQHQSLAKRKNPESKIARAIKKYGVEQFSFSVIEECETQEEANEAEIAWIKLFKSLNPELGYNLTPGGKVFSPTPEIRARISKTLTGVKHSLERRIKSSLSRKGIKHLHPRPKGSVPWNKGTKGLIKSWNKGIKLSLLPNHSPAKYITYKKLTEEQILKIVELYNTKQYFSCEIAKMFNVDPTVVIGHMLLELFIIQNLKNQNKFYINELESNNRLANSII